MSAVHDPPSGTPQTPAFPPPPQVAGAAQGLHEAVRPPHPLLCGPQLDGYAAHVSGTQLPASGAPQTPAVPPPPHDCPAGQFAQLAVRLPQPSLCSPQVPAG